MNGGETIVSSEPGGRRLCVLYYRERPSEPEANAAALEQQNRTRAAFEESGATIVATFREVETSLADAVDVPRPMFQRAFDAAVCATAGSHRVEVVVLRADPIGSGTRFPMNSPYIKKLEASNPLVSINYQGCEGLERQLEHEWRYATRGDESANSGHIAANVVMRCASCGSTDVKRDAWAAWDISAQAWVLGSVFDDAHCDTCGRTSIEAVEDPALSA